MAPKTVESFLESNGQWQKTLTILRDLACSTGMEEAIKWGIPVYSYKGKNVLGISAFKSYAGLWFYQGALLPDEKKVLMNAQEGKTKAMRQWRFGPGEKIPKPTVLRYMQEAMKLVDDGKEIKPEKNKALEIPAELQQALAGNKALQQAFGSLSLSHKREYADYIAEAKQAVTRERRLEKVTGMILNKTGLHDHYRK